MRTDFIDYPTGFELQHEIGYEPAAHLSPHCSAVQTNGAVLCDCGAIAVQWTTHGGTDWRRYVPTDLLDQAEAKVNAHSPR